MERDSLAHTKRARVRGTRGTVYRLRDFRRLRWGRFPYGTPETGNGLNPPQTREILEPIEDSWGRTKEDHGLRETLIPFREPIQAESDDPPHAPAGRVWGVSEAFSSEIRFLPSTKTRRGRWKGASSGVISQ